jgi:tetratricopeptide (TPR) repeat protein
VRGVTLVGLAVATIAHVSAPALAADPKGSARAEEALALCNKSDDVPTAEKAALLDRSLALAEEAIAADGADAKAHFAAFCALGHRMELDGTSVRSLFALRRLRQEIDRTLELAPDYSDAMVGKASLLLDAPRLLGGDATEAERLLRRALAIDPEYGSARLRLASALAGRGAKDEARVEARRALATAERKNDTAQAADARALLAKLGD